MIELNQVMFGVVWPVVAAAAVMIALWRVWKVGPRDATRAWTAGAVSVAAGALVATWGLTQPPKVPPVRIEHALGLAAILAGGLALVVGVARTFGPRRETSDAEREARRRGGWIAVALGAAMGVAACALVVWPWLAQGRERSREELLMVLAGIGAAALLSGLLSAAGRSASKEPGGWVAMLIVVGGLGVASAPMLAVGGSWMSAALIAGAMAAATAVTLVASVRRKNLGTPGCGAAAGAACGAAWSAGALLPAVWLGAHLAADLPWWAGLVMAASPIGWWAGSIGPIRRAKSPLRLAVRVVAVAALAGVAVAAAVSQAPIDSYLDYAP